MRLRQRLVQPVPLGLETVPDLRRLRIGALLRGGVAARREVVCGLARPRDELQGPVALQLEGAPVDEASLDVLRRLREELRLRDRCPWEDEAGAGRWRGGEVALVVVDLRLAAEVETGVERAVDGLELLLLVDAGGDECSVIPGRHPAADGVG